LIAADRHFGSRREPETIAASVSSSAAWRSVTSFGRASERARDIRANFHHREGLPMGHAVLPDYLTRYDRIGVLKIQMVRLVWLNRI
jgi:hypothetical protein